jgi:PRTRC genetic system protein A
MSPLDTALQSVTPTVMVPRFGPFEPLQENGHRFLAAMDGLWLEVRRSWLYFLHPIAQQSVVSMPYGALEPDVSILCGKIPHEMLQMFKQYAEQRAPCECAAWITWNEHDGRFTYRLLEEISSSHAHADVVRPLLEDGEHLVLDLHSHGCEDAFFSPKDDKDDRGEVKLVGVMGGFGNPKAVPTVARLSVLGIFIPLGDMPI